MSRWKDYRSRRSRRALVYVQELDACEVWRSRFDEFLSNSLYGEMLQFIDTLSIEPSVLFSVRGHSIRQYGCVVSLWIFPTGISISETTISPPIPRLFQMVSRSRDRLSYNRLVRSACSTVDSQFTRVITRRYHGVPPLSPEFACPASHEKRAHDER